ncbi:Protein SRG1 [Forsythia ovata]|uniref:Protein SRG1 n=1 Tax=Forsythia ovata TaxID=205694 RepID=A0ABD1T7B4_9LAMI
METEVVSVKEYGGSLPVQNVQKLASHNSKGVPYRYVRPEIEIEKVSVDGLLQIPVIDMSKLDTEKSAVYNQELLKLHLACKEWGFFQLINHGASEEIEEMKVVTSEFFKLPLEEKMAYAQTPNTIEGYGQAFVVSEDQKLDWGDMLFLVPLPVSRRNLRFWPKTPASFTSTLEKYSIELQKVAIKVLTSMAINLGIDPEKLTTPYKDCNQGIRMNYYPPCVHADKVIGLTPHSDATGLTLLIQINEVQGLQIKKDKEWVPIKPVVGAIIINIGDVMEIMSNGEYSSIEHRAVVDFKKERLSIAAFHSPNFTTEIGPLPDLVVKKGEKYKTISHEEYIRLVIASKLDGKSLLEHMRIQQS